MGLTAGVGRTVITPYRGVELTGWGYYLERTWQTIHDDLHATALVLGNGRTTLAVISLDLMVISDEFTRTVRQAVHKETEIPESHILVTATHTHNAPASGGLLGVGEVDPVYEEWAARQAATAAILAWQNQEDCRLQTSRSSLAGHTFNRTRDNGAVDPTVTTLRVDRRNGNPLAVVVNFQAHPTVQTVLQPYAVARDVPGEVCDLLEAALPGATALYLQGACGDVNFLKSYSTPELCHEPARLVAGHALAGLNRSQPAESSVLAAHSDVVRIPTRRWTREEIENDREEAQRRLKDNDTRGWRETIGRAMTNRPDDMVARHGGNEWHAVRAMCRFNLAWTFEMLKDWETRPEHLETEVQALRIGELAIVANSSEFFTSLALDVRNRSGMEYLMIAAYSNGRIGYMPDAHDIAARSYAAYQSPKYCNQFPFTNESGPAMCDGMLAALKRCRDIS